MKMRSTGYLLAMVVAAQLCFGQAFKGTTEKRSETVLVRIPGAEVVSEDSDNAGTHLSHTFVLAATKSASALREWQSHLSYTIKNGYPPSGLWIAADRDRAAEELRLAELAASTDADREVVQQLSAEFETMDNWTAGGLDAYKNLRAASYYMSPAALQNDETFQHSARCTQAIQTVLAKRQVTEQPLCR
jgi:hypothetical protein